MTIGNLVCRRLLAEKNWPSLEAWCQTFWEGGVRDYFGRTRAVGEQEGTNLLLTAYLEALAQQGKASGRQRLLQEFRELPGHPQFGSPQASNTILPQ